MGGNYLIMPIAFTIFFIFTQKMFEHSNPEPERVLTFHEALHTKLEENVCATGDAFSQSLYSTF